MKVIEDPVLAGRLVSVFSGFATMLGLWMLSYELFKSKYIAFIAAILYVTYPFAQVHDRMALMDSMVATFFVWAVYFSILLARHVRLDIAYTLGFVIGGGVLTKSIGFLNIYLLPLTLLLFDLKSKNLLQRVAKWAVLALFVVIVSQLIYSILRLSPYFHMIDAKNETFIYPLREWIKHPIEFLPGNLQGLTTWLFEYLSYLSMI